MSNPSLMILATYGLEIVECGGTLAKHAAAGWDVHAAVLLSRPESRHCIFKASSILGVKTRFMGYETGDVHADKKSKKDYVKVIRETRPSAVIIQDPEHSFGDMDPDRREAMILYMEALSLAGRDFAVGDCGGLEPHMVKSIYYMTPERPNCVVDVSSFFSLKEKALDELGYQLEYTAMVLRKRMGDNLLKVIAPACAGAVDDLETGRILHNEMERAHALHYGIAGHSDAILGEAFRKEGLILMEYL